MVLVVVVVQKLLEVLILRLWMVAVVAEKRQPVLMFVRDFGVVNQVE